jgi:hypothetical protein
MREANFTTVFVGVESPNLSALAGVKKTQNTRGDILASLRRIYDHGIQVQAGMIVGFDEDQPAIFEQQAAFAQQAEIPIVMAGMLQAVEGTPLHARIAAEGRLIHAETGDQFSHTNIIPKQMTLPELYAGYRSLLTQLYDWRAYEERVVGFLRRRGERQRSGRRVSQRDLRALLGISGLLVGRHGLHRAYSSWRLLIRVIRHRPSAFREALSFLLMHKAMFDYTELVVDHLAAPELLPPPGSSEPSPTDVSAAAG